MDADADTLRTDGPSPDASSPAEIEIHAAAAALGISSEALRKRIARGTVPARKVAGVWMVTLDPDTPGRTDTRPSHDNTPGHATTRPRPASRTDAPDVGRLQERITGLEAQLAQAQADRDRWHEQATGAQEHYLRDMAAMRELVAREQAIALRATTRTDAGRTDASSSEDGQDATVQDAAVPTAPKRPWWHRVIDLFGGS